MYAKSIWNVSGSVCGLYYFVLATWKIFFSFFQFDDVVWLASFRFITLALVKFFDL